MNFKYGFRLIFILIVLLGTSCHQKSLSRRGDTVYKIGNQKEWAELGYETNSWEEEIDLEGGEIFWSRTQFNLLETPKEHQSFGIDLVNTFGEFEVYWDGILIGKNGNPGQEARLGRSGEMWETFRIPQTLSNKGRHVLALKRSLYYYPDHIRFNAFVNDYDYLLEFPLVYTGFMYIFAGAFLLAALYFFFLFLGNKKEKPILIFSISCFLFFALILTEFIRTYISIHYSQHEIRMEIISYLTFFIAILVPLYFSLQFPFPKRKLILGIYIAILIYVFYRNHHHYDQTSYDMALCMWFVSLGIISFGVYKKLKGASIVLLTLVICAIINYNTYFDTSLFAGFGVIVLGMFYILAIKAKEQRLAYEKTLVQSTRLRLELLKKNIQPHFLMNSLTSLIDWVEESPSKGVSFIEALAKEFDLINQIEGKTLIPIHQEVELCRTHLEIMKFRKEIDYLWEEEGILENEHIPPATLHTLLENGITHCAPLSDNSIRFKLIFETNSQFKSYTFLTIAKVRPTTKKTTDGTGLKYIKARLEESYGNLWSFSSEATKDGWKNIIKIYN